MNDLGTDFVAEDGPVSQSMTVWMRWTLTKAALFKFQKHHFPVYLCKAKSMIVKPQNNCLGLSLLRQLVLFPKTTVRTEKKNYLMKLERKRKNLIPWKL